MLPIVGDCYITQQYGKTAFAKANPAIYKNFGGIHPGIDFGTHGLTLECMSLIRGKVVYASVNNGWGNYVEVLGDDGWRRQYAHLSSIRVKLGDIVNAGDVIGRVGTTGQSTGVHLHYGNRRSKLLGGWEYRDPSPDLLSVQAQKPVMPTSLLIKGSSPEIYVYNGKMKFHIPDMATYSLLFNGAPFEVVGEDIVTKIPEGAPLPSLK